LIPDRQQRYHFLRGVTLGWTGILLTAIAHYNRGVLLQKKGRLASAEDSYRLAVAGAPTNPQFHYNLATVLAQQDRYEDAIAEYKETLLLRPRFADALNNLGNILIETGRVAQGVYYLECALKETPDRVGTYYNLSRARKLAHPDEVLWNMERLAADLSLPTQEQIHLHFALGKSLDDIGERERSFGHFVAGNRVKRAVINYNEGDTLARVRHIPQVFSRERLVSAVDYGCLSTVPVFILGMPRSGTTLIEQILAAHPMAWGTGESSHIERAFAEAMPGQGLGATFPNSDISGATLQRMGEMCLAEMRSASPGAARIVNKSISNFLVAGLIHLAMPSARFIHVLRDPLDTCLSCFSTLFAGSHLPYTYDLKEIARYYKAYAFVMQHWRSVIPSDRLLEMRYEEIVTDPAPAVRRALDYCGLNWHERCLTFCDLPRVVKTASSVQVRQPLFRTSVGRWRRYAEFLGPLLSELG
jgi:hypothetical protein